MSDVEADPSNRWRRDTRCGGGVVPVGPTRVRRARVIIGDANDQGRAGSGSPGTFGVDVADGYRHHDAAATAGGRTRTT